MFEVLEQNIVFQKNDKSSGRSYQSWDDGIELVQTEIDEISEEEIRNSHILGE